MNIYRSIGLSLEGVRIWNWNRQSNTAQWRDDGEQGILLPALALLRLWLVTRQPNMRLGCWRGVTDSRWKAGCPLIGGMPNHWLSHCTIARGNYRRIKQSYIHTYIHIHTHTAVYIYIYNWYVVRSLVILACWHRFQSHSATKYVRPGSRFQVFNLWDEAEETIYIVWAWADNTSCLRWCKLYITLYIHIYILQLYLYHHTTNVSLSTWMPRRPVESWRSCGPPRDAGGLPGRFFEVFNGESP